MPGGRTFQGLKYLAAAAMLAAAAEAQATVDYTVDLTSPEHHLAQVSAVFPATPAPYLEVKMPAWRTGRYTILDLANGVRRFTATDAWQSQSFSGRVRAFPGSFLRGEFERSASFPIDWFPSPRYLVFPEE